MMPLRLMMIITLPPDTICRAAHARPPLMLRCHADDVATLIIDMSPGDADDAAR